MARAFDRGPSRLTRTGGTRRKSADAGAEPGSRVRLIEATGRLLWRQGLRATGIQQIIEESGAPRGSIYFHFPGGKEQLCAEALRSAGAVMTRNITAALAARDGRTAINRFIDAYGKEMRDSDFHHGCPVATVALEAAAVSPTMRDVCASVFAEWEDLLVVRLREDGLAPRTARDLAVVILSAIEGAMILCRARRSSAPLMQVRAHLLSALAAART